MSQQAETCEGGGEEALPRSVLLLDLPEEVILLIIEWVPWRSLVVLGRCCRTLKRLSDVDAIWHRLVERDEWQHLCPLNVQIVPDVTTVETHAAFPCSVQLLIPRANREWKERHLMLREDFRVLDPDLPSYCCPASELAIWNREEVDQQQELRSQLAADYAALPSEPRRFGSFKRHFVWQTKQLTKLDRGIAKLKKMHLLSESRLRTVCHLVMEELAKEPNVLRLEAPIVVVGDIHGQLHDLLQIFDLVGWPPNVSYLFLGDYVNRGLYCVEVMTLLLLLKARYPSRVHLLRGSNECRQLTQVYGFYDECLNKYHKRAMAWAQFCAMFDYLPLAAVISDKVLCVHGGLAPNASTLKELDEINRFQDTPHEGVMHDLVWSDPEDMQGWSEIRGTWLWGEDISKNWNTTNGLDFIVRAHQLAMEGYKWMHDKNCLTVFSAPNYCGRCGNQGAVLLLDDRCQPDFVTYDSVAPERPAEPRAPIQYFI